MRYLQKLPILLALAAAFITGVIGLIRSFSQKQVLVQMVLSMILFFVIGLLARSTLLNVIAYIDEKRKKREQEELLKQQEAKRQSKQSENDADILGRNIDFTAGNMDDDAFEPLPVSEFIRKELKQEER